MFLKWTFLYIFLQMMPQVTAPAAERTFHVVLLYVK